MFKHNFSIRRNIVGVSMFVLLGTLNANTLDDCITAYKAGDLVKAESLCMQYVKANKNSFEANDLITKTFYLEGKFKEALSYAKKTENLAKTLNDYGAAYSNLSVIYGVLGDKKEDLKYTQKYLDIALKTGNNDKIATAYNNLGAYYHGLHNLDDALKYYKKSLEYDNKDSSTYANIGIIYSQQKNYDLSLKYDLKAIEIDVGNKDYRNEAFNRVSIASNYIMLEKYDLAEDMLSKALVISKREGFINIEAYTLKSYGLLYARKGDNSKAKAYMAKAYEIYKETGDKAGAEDCMRALSKLQ